jgi:hypothetical protein
MTLHLGYPTVTQGHQLTGLTPVARTKQSSPLWLNQTELTGLTPVAKPNRAHRPHPCSQTNQNPALDQTQTNHTPLIMWKVHVTRDHQQGYHDSLHSAEAAQLYPQVGDFIAS